MQMVNGLHFRNVRGDIFGGLTAAVVALPLALAFGVSSGAGPVAGLYGAIFVGLFAALFGGTPAQISGPTGPMTVVMAAIFTEYTGLYPDDPASGAAIAFSVVMLGGFFQILFGVFRLGNYINMMPHPVISGFMNGIGVIILLLQIGPLLGHVTPGGPLASAQALPGMLSHPVMDATVLGIVSVLIVYLLPARISRVVPAPLVALITGTLMLMYIFPGGEATVLGDIPTGLPDPQMPVFPIALLPDMVKSGLVLAALGSIDSLLTSLVADNVTRTHHKSNRELIGQGIANMVAGLFGGLPGAGATMRTVVNVKAGGRTPVSGVLHALVLLVIVLGAGSLAGHIPHAVLAGILLKVGTDIIDWDYLKRLRSAPRAGVIIMFTVMFITVFVDLITAVGVGVVMASFIFMKRMTDLQLNSARPYTSADEEPPLSPEEKRILRESNNRILLYHLSGPLSFSSAKGVVRKLADFDQYDVLIIDLSDVTQIDFTSARSVEDMILDARAREREVALVVKAGSVESVLRRQGVIAKLPEGREFQGRLDALRFAEGRLAP